MFVRLRVPTNGPGITAKLHIHGETPSTQAATRSHYFLEHIHPDFYLLSYIILVV
jgi:hypothetical protein